MTGRHATVTGGIVIPHPDRSDGRHRVGRSVADTIALVFMRDPNIRAACLTEADRICSCLLVPPLGTSWYDDTLADLEGIA